MGMMHDNDSMPCMMGGDSKTTGQCLQMMLGDEKHQTAIIEALKANPELREQVKQLVQKAEQ